MNNADAVFSGNDALFGHDHFEYAYQKKQV